MEIYVICTRNRGGRFVQGGATDLRRAVESCAHFVEGLTADGWDLEQVRDIPDGGEIDLTGPAVIRVSHLRRAADWCNVELYKIETKQ